MLTTNHSGELKKRYCICYYLKIYIVRLSIAGEEGGNTGKMESKETPESEKRISISNWHKKKPLSLAPIIFLGYPQKELRPNQFIPALARVVILNSNSINKDQKCLNVIKLRSTKIEFNNHKMNAQMPMAIKYKTLGIKSR